MGFSPPPFNLSSINSRTPSTIGGQFGSSTEARRNFSDAATRSFCSWAPTSWLQFLSMGSLYFPFENNLGINGDNTVNMVTRLSSVLALSPKPSFITLAAIGNDISGSIATDELSLKNITLTNYLRTVDYFRAIGIIPICYTAQTQNGMTATQLQLMARAHEALRYEMAKRPNVAFTDVTGLIFDPNGASYSTLASLMVDTAHFNPLGSYVVAKAQNDYMKSMGLLPATNLLMRSAADIFDDTYNVTGNLLAGGMMTGNGGTLNGGSPAIGGTYPTGWIANNNANGATCSMSQGADSAGQPYTQMNLSGTFNGGASSLTLFQDVSSANLAKIRAGDVLEMIALSDNDSSTNIECTSINFQVTTSGSDVTVWDMQPQGAVGPSTAYKGVHHTPRYTVPAVPTRVRARLTLNLGRGSSGISVAAVSRWAATSLRKVVTN